MESGQCILRTLQFLDVWIEMMEFRAFSMFWKSKKRLFQTLSLNTTNMFGVHSTYMNTSFLTVSMVPSLYPDLLSHQGRIIIQPFSSITNEIYHLGITSAKNELMYSYYFLSRYKYSVVLKHHIPLERKYELLWRFKRSIDLQIAPWLTSCLISTKGDSATHRKIKIGWESISIKSKLQAF